MVKHRSTFGLMLLAIQHLQLVMLTTIYTVHVQTISKYNGTIPSFIGNDYYCDSGVDSKPEVGKFYTTPLWTGEGCTPPNFCCSRSGMPWFCKTLPVPTTDYIELHNCHNELVTNEDTALELIELYIY